MPLNKSKSKAAFKSNVSEMVKSGHPRDQALAASYRIMRKASGGPVALDPLSPAEKYDDGPTQWQEHRDTVQRLLNQDLVDMPMYEPPDTMDNNEMNPYPMQSVRFFGDYAPMNHAAGGTVAPKYAEGGQAPWYTRQAASRMGKSGLLRGATPGRTDNKNIGVGSGSYIVPADIVSGMGQGNTQAGASVLSTMFKAGPMGIPKVGGRSGGASRIRAGKVPKGGKISPFAEGGDVEMGVPEGPQEEVPIVAASGEFVLSPEEVTAFGGGDMKAGHSALDAFVKYARQQIIKEMKNLKGPVKS